MVYALLLRSICQPAQFHDHVSGTRCLLAQDNDTHLPRLSFSLYLAASSSSPGSISQVTSSTSLYHCASGRLTDYSAMLESLSTMECVDLVDVEPLQLLLCDCYPAILLDLKCTRPTFPIGDRVPMHSFRHPQRLGSLKVTLLPLHLDLERSRKQSTMTLTLEHLAT